jgi:hypothetical protein
VSDKEQMAVVLRYVDKHGLILERLVGVVHVKETSAICLKTALQKLFVDIGFHSLYIYRFYLHVFFHENNMLCLLSPYSGCYR